MVPFFWLKYAVKNTTFVRFGFFLNYNMVNLFCRSEGVACSICLDIVREKANLSERMFGILGTSLSQFN